MRTTTNGAGGGSRGHDGYRRRLHEPRVCELEWRQHVVEGLADGRTHSPTSPRPATTSPSRSDPSRSSSFVSRTVDRGALQRLHAIAATGCASWARARERVLVPVPRLAPRYRRHRCCRRSTRRRSRQGTPCDRLSSASGALRLRGPVSASSASIRRRAARRFLGIVPSHLRRLRFLSAGRSPSLTAPSRSPATGRCRSTRSTRRTTSPATPVDDRVRSATTRARSTTVATTSIRV